ncbi:aspartic proteinase CDR1-like [Rhododendron vialii]|uniref:aspartic proteinase CDR1-like n=1 Tax=Rhododendron vialii TaxID=182163 RepID=UPI00265E82CA|nr:aspartic proteinase CDR1-like [Rhododendron vialii]
MHPLLAFTFVHLLLLISPTKIEADGFTVDLIHRDSPQSPFYDPSISKSDRLANAIRRSFSRVARFNELSRYTPNNDIQSPLFPSGGEYLMKLSIGTPPLKTTLLADTGGDLSWTQCRPCVKCFKQNSTIFDPKKSWTYKELPCGSQPCKALRKSTCKGAGKNGTARICEYRYGYADKSYTIGDVATDTFTFGSSSGRPVSVGKIVFGCGHNNGGTYNAATTGVIGLGGGSLSLVRQLGDSIGGKFSYCLVTNVDDKFTSKISFGDKAVVSGPGVVSTPFVFKGKFNYYYLTLESIIVGNKRLGYETKMPPDTRSGSVSGEGNIIIDSGTVLTFLPSRIFANLESHLGKVIKEQPMKDPGGVFKLCYRDDNIDHYPSLTFKFKGAEVELPALITFFQVGKLLCLAMAPTDDVAVFGNLSQENFLIGYDLVKKQISFKPTNCSKNKLAS